MVWGIRFGDPRVRTRPNWKIHPLFFALLLVPCLFFYCTQEANALGCIAEVNSTDDNSDVDGCNVNHCSLREAIALVNSFPNDNINSICFNLAGTYPTIQLNSPLPDLFTSMTIHSPNIPNPTGRIVINGSNEGGVGLRITGGNVTIHNLVIQNFDVGVEVRDSGHLRLGSSFIGTNGPGDMPAPNRIGVALYSSSNSIGKSFLSGNQVTSRNIISGNIEHGILIEGPSASNNLIADNFIGTKASGNEGLSNGGNGIFINHAPNNQIGGIGLGNIISGNISSGIQVTGSQATQTSIRYNKIGVILDGNTKLGNGGDGIQVLEAENNFIEENIISGNGNSGIFLGQFSDQNEIKGNHIGLGENGTIPLGNSEHGIYILDGNSNIVGGPDNSLGNVIGDNGGNGIYLRGEAVNNTSIQGNKIGTDHDGLIDIGNHQHGIEILQAENNQVGGSQSGEGNLISGNDKDGILIWGDVADGNKVLGNLIGLKAGGNGPLGNTRDGIRISRVIQHPDVSLQEGGPSHNIIGGPSPGERNIISGNGKAGITLEGKNTSLNKIYGNFVGTDPTGAQAQGNGTEGIHITLGEAPQESLPKPGPPINNTIGSIEGITPGGSCTGGCNLISGNGADGIRIDGVEVSGNNILANFIGADVSGTKALPNQAHGVAIVGAHKNDVGDYPVQSGEPNPHRNLISGNTGFGIYIFGGLAKNNQVIGNFIGTDTTGKAPLGNAGGILVEFSNGNLLGDAAESSGNLISGNAGPGIVIDDSHNTFIQNNRIGVNTEGLVPLPNQGPGIHIINASTANTIGGENSDQGNHIAFNLGDGVQVSGLRNIEIIGNSLHDNTGMGIDLAPIGINANDAGDADEGVNELQNFPELTSVVPFTLEIEVQGTLQGLPNRQYRIHFYSNESCDGENHSQGQYYLGVGMVTTDGTGLAQFATVVPRVGGEMITATATDDSRNTSEFSTCLKVGTGPGVDLDLDGVLNTDDNCMDDPNPDQADQDADKVGDICDICPDMNDGADLDFNQVPDCLELLVRGAGHTCSLNPSTSNRPVGPWFMGFVIALMLFWRMSTTNKGF